MPVAPAQPGQLPDGDLILSHTQEISHLGCPRNENPLTRSLLLFRALSIARVVGGATLVLSGGASISGWA